MGKSSYFKAEVDFDAYIGYLSFDNYAFFIPPIFKFSLGMTGN